MIDWLIDWQIDWLIGWLTHTDLERAVAIGVDLPPARIVTVEHVIARHVTVRVQTATHQDLRHARQRMKVHLWRQNTNVFTFTQFFSTLWIWEFINMTSSRSRGCCCWPEWTRCSCWDPARASRLSPPVDSRRPRPCWRHTPTTAWRRHGRESSAKLALCCTTGLR